MAEVNFKYDAAFSFLDPDETLARELAALLPPLTTFVYSEAQLAISGADGVDAFAKVFRRDARIVVVLYRSGWGKTKWTRIEEEAIKARYFEDGAEFVTLVQLDKVVPVPDWFPVVRIWLDFDRFGINGATGVIQERVKQAGGAVRAETPQENATRLAREQRAEVERVVFLHSEAGVSKANETVQNLLRQLEIISRETGIAFDQEPRYAVLYKDGFSVAVSWAYEYRNTLDPSALSVMEWKGRPDVGAKRFHSPERREIARHEFQFDVTSTQDPIWRGDRRGGRTFTTEGLADYSVNLLIERIRGDMRRS